MPATKKKGKSAEKVKIKSKTPTKKATKVTKSSKVYNFDSYDYPVMNVQTKKVMCKWIEFSSSKIKNLEEESRLLKNAYSAIHKHCGTGGPGKYVAMFTSGTINANCAIIKMVTEAYQTNIEKKPHVVTTQLENYNTLRWLQDLEDNDYITVTYVRPTINGLITTKSVKEALTANTCLVSIIYADNIIGTYSNIPEIAYVVSKYQTPEGFKIPFHVDMGFLFSKYKISLDAKKNKDIDSMTISFDYLGGPKGIGMLLVKRTLVDGFGLNIKILEENNDNRSISTIAGSVEAIKHNFIDRSNKNSHLLRLKIRFIKNIKKKFQLLNYIDFLDEDHTTLRFNKGKKNKRRIVLLGALKFEEKILPNIITLLILGEDNSTTIEDKLYKHGILVSSVSKEEIPYLDLPDFLKEKIIRISYTDNCTESDIDFLTKKLNIIL